MLEVFYKMREIMSRSPSSTQAAESYEAFFDRLDSSGRSNVDRHLAACQAEPTHEHVRLWKRLAAFLASLTPHSIRTTGQKAVQFYVADGKYRQQLFALEDMRDGKLSVYAVDALEAATRAGLFRPRADSPDQGSTYVLCDYPDEYLRIETLTAATTTSAPDYYKHLLGWNRKAVRISIPTNATPAQILVVEGFCTIAAEQTLAELTQSKQ